ncbi:MAG: phage gp6-like head-tail connector protein [Proteobacteria bacterium]|nr:phage gp6-like head-tail connector protein [Pseudomonadota bacterium]
MLDFADTKTYLRVDHYDDDALIQMLMDTATAAAADYLNMPLEQMTTTVPSPIKSAALLLVGNLYENRESMSDRPYSKNPTFEALLNPYRVHS